MIHLKRLFLLISLINFCLISAFSQTKQGITFGGYGNDVGLSICPADNGGYAIAGSTRSFGEGSNDFYFLLVDSSGLINISRTYGWSHQDFFRSIIPVNNGYAFVGDTWHTGPGGLDIYMLLTDKNGSSEKGYMYGTLKRDNGFNILETNDNGFLILGHSRLENPKGDIYLLKVDSEGNEVWQKSFWDTGNDYAFQLIKSSQNDGYIFIGSKNGFFDDVHADFKEHDADIIVIKIDEDGNQLWKKVYGKSEHDFGYSICNATDGGYYLFGSSQSYSNGSFDMLLIKTDKDGNQEWIKNYGGTEYEYGKKVITNKDSGLYLIGSSKSFGTNNSTDVFIVKTDDEGNEIWSEVFGGSGNDFGEDAIALPEGGCAIVGSTSSYGEGGSDVYLLRLKANGELDLFSTIPSTPVNKIVFYPNPMIGSGRFVMPKTVQNSYTIKLYDTFGSCISNETFIGNRFIQKRDNLSAGIYIYTITSNDNPEEHYRGKIIVR